MRNYIAAMTLAATAHLCGSAILSATSAVGQSIRCAKLNRASSEFLCTTGAASGKPEAETATELETLLPAISDKAFKGELR